MPAQTQNQVRCSCLTSKMHGGTVYFNVNEVATAMMHRFGLTAAQFAAMPFDSFQPYYRSVTNDMVREGEYYRNLSLAEQTAFDSFLEKRCVNCGFMVLRSFRDAQTVSPQAKSLEAA